VDTRAPSSWRQAWGLRILAQPSFARLAAILVASLCLLSFIRFILGPLPLLDLYVHLDGATDWQHGLDPYRTYLMRSPGELGGGYVFPPYTLPLFLAIAHLPRPTAAGLWLAAECATLAWLIWDLALPRSPLRLAALLVLVVFFTPVLTNIALGQVGIFTLGGAWAAGRLAERVSSRAGLLLAAAGMFKLFPLSFGASLLQRHRWRTVAWALAAIVVALLITLPLVFGLWPEYVGGVLLGHVGGANPSPGNQSLASAVVRSLTSNRYQQPLLVAPALARVLSVVLPLALLGAVFATLRNRVDERLRDAIVLACMPLVVPNAWQHYYVLALPLLWIVISAGLIRRSPWLLAVSAVALIGLSWFPATIDESYFEVARVAPAWHGFYANSSVIAGVLLLLTGLYLARAGYSDVARASSAVA